MKKNIMIYLLMALVCFGLQSCLFQEEDYFDDSSANRATEEVKQYSELLESASNGWRMEYYIGQDYALGGITLLCKFDGQRVTMASQGYEGDETISSLYKLVRRKLLCLHSTLIMLLSCICQATRRRFQPQCQPARRLRVYYKGSFSRENCNAGQKVWKYDSNVCASG